LEGFLGVEPGMVMGLPTKLRSAGRAPSFELNAGIRPTTEEKSRKNLSQGGSVMDYVGFTLFIGHEGS
jgi:hypothetical protein